MSTTLALANQKGGVGKSTVAVNVAVELGRSGRRVLLGDLDPQGNAGDMLSVQTAEQPSWLEVFEGASDVRSARIHDVAVGVDLICAPEQSRLAGVEQGLVTVAARERWLQRVLAGQHDDYDWVILDCPPSLGQLTTNALIAADRIVSPVDLTDANAVKGLNELHRSVLELRDVGFAVATPEVLLNCVDDRRLTVRAFRAIVGELGLPILDHEIPMSAQIANGVAEGRPIVLRTPRHQAAVAFHHLAEELAA